MDAFVKRRLARDEQYKILIEGITDYAVYMLSPEGIVITWNLGAERLKGYLEKEIVGQHFSKFYLPKDCEAGAPQTALDTAAMVGRFEKEAWRVRKGGGRFWANVVINAIYDNQGELLGFAKITRDLTERRNAAAELRKSEQQFRLLLRGVTDYAIYILDPQGRVSSWNLGAERIKGFQSDEIIGQHFSRFYTPEDIAIDEPSRTLDTAARAGRYECEAWRVRKDGTHFWANVVIDAVRDEKGELIGYAKITRDISEKLKASHAHEQTREQLFQAQKVEAIGQLTGGIAHDFNNLLMAISGSLELLSKRIPYSMTTMPLVENAIRGAERGKALVKQLLAFARRQELRYESIDIASLVDASKGLFQLSLGSSVTVSINIPPGLPRVKSDSNQLVNALLNLALNARDAMPVDGTVTVTAQMRETQMPPCRYVCLSIADEGSGMDEATLTEATLPFFTTKGSGNGTGLGLSMVKGLMEQSGGKLMLLSQKGVGTEAQLWLPLAESDEAAVPLEETWVAPATCEALNVIAVDDDDLVLMNTVLMLEELGHVVMEARSGAEALNIFDANPSVDLVVTDHAMPRMTGSQLADAIGMRNPKVRCILATGYAELPAGGNRELLRLEKPFTQDELLETVRRAMA